MSIEKISNLINLSIASKQKINDEIKISILKSVEIIENTFKKQNKLLICGNGGSAADSQHIAAEFVSRYLIERDALFAIALNCNTSSLTAISNDYSYDNVFARQVEAFARKDDVLWAISTSGNSKNVINAVLSAKKRGVITIGMTGFHGGKLKDICDIIICAPSDHTTLIFLP